MWRQNLTMNHKHMSNHLTLCDKLKPVLNSWVLDLKSIFDIHLEEVASAMTINKGPNKALKTNMLCMMIDRKIWNYEDASRTNLILSSSALLCLSITTKKLFNCFQGSITAGSWHTIPNYIVWHESERGNVNRLKERYRNSITSSIDGPKLQKAKKIKLFR